MMGLEAVPTELFDLIIEHLVVTIGIPRAVLLRTVSHAFDTAILRAICVRQVVDIEDPGTPNLISRICPSLKGKILLVKSYSADASSERYVSVVAHVNRTLDTLIGDRDPEAVRSRHKAIAEAVIPSRHRIDSKIEAQNVLSGAVISGQLSVLKTLLEDSSTSSISADLNVSTPYFYSPLALAAACGHIEVVRYLLDRGARLDSVSGNWLETHRMVNHANWNAQPSEIRSMLLREDHPSALRAAVLSCHRDIVELLLQLQYRLPTSSVEYLRALVAGAQAGRLDFVETLLKTIGKDISWFADLGKEMMWQATRHDQKEVIQMLLDTGVDIHAFAGKFTNHSGTLSIAAFLGNVAMIRFLIERGADINFVGRDKPKPLPIEAAARCGQEEVVDILLEHGADPGDAFYSAAGGGQTRLIKSLLYRFPDLISREEGEIGRMALCKAVCIQNLALITALVEAGVSLDHGYDCYEHLPLNVAKGGCPPWVVDHLISLGAQETGELPDPRGELAVDVRGIRVSERTWEWVSKY